MTGTWRKRRVCWACHARISTRRSSATAWRGRANERSRWGRRDAEDRPADHVDSEPGRDTGARAGAGCGRAGAAEPPRDIDVRRDGEAHAGVRAGRRDRVLAVRRPVRPRPGGVPRRRRHADRRGRLVVDLDLEASRTQGAHGVVAAVDLGHRARRGGRAAARRIREAVCESSGALDVLVVDEKLLVPSLRLWAFGRRTKVESYQLTVP